jgi:hypothetical protein
MEIFKARPLPTPYPVHEPPTRAKDRDHANRPWETSRTATTAQRVAQHRVLPLHRPPATSPCRGARRASFDPIARSRREPLRAAPSAERAGGTKTTQIVGQHRVLSRHRSIPRASPEGSAHSIQTFRARSPGRCSARREERPSSPRPKATFPQWRLRGLCGRGVYTVDPYECRA